MSDTATDTVIDEADAGAEVDVTADEQPSRRRPSLGPVIALGLAAAVAVAAIVVAFVGGDDVSATALTVNGTRTTTATLNAELDGFAGSTFFANSYAEAQQPQPFSASPGSLSSLATAQWLSFRTQTTFAEQILDRRGAPLTQAQVNAAVSALAQQGVTDGMSDESAEDLARFSASSDALTEELGSYEASRAAIGREAQRASITLAERYGRWNERTLAYCVPLGCRAGGATVVPPEQTSSGG
jgi:hypothetical protein